MVSHTINSALWCLLTHGKWDRSTSCPQCWAWPDMWAGWVWQAACLTETKCDNRRNAWLLHIPAITSQTVLKKFQLKLSSDFKFLMKLVQILYIIVLDNHLTQVYYLPTAHRFFFVSLPVVLSEQKVLLHTICTIFFLVNVHTRQQSLVESLFFSIPYRM